MLFIAKHNNDDIACFGNVCIGGHPLPNGNGLYLKDKTSLYF